jgi:Tfp pilus assembly protein PilF
MALVKGKDQSSHPVKSSRGFRLETLGFLIVPTICISGLIYSGPSPLVVSAHTVFAPAQVKSKIQQELDSKSSPNKPATSASKKTTNAGHSRSTGRRSGPVEYPLTFMSDVPGAEIALDGVVVGKINEERRLTVKVKQGQYKATASLKGYQPQSMNVTAYGTSSYTIKLGKPIPVPPAPAPTPAATPLATPTPEAESDVTTAPSSDDILKRFMDPRETQNVTVEEWQSVVAENEQLREAQPTRSQAVARYHLGRGQLAYLKKDYADSVAEFNRALTALPLSGIAYYGLANAYLATNQPVEASRAYQRAVALTPEVAALVNKGLGDASTKLGKHKEANAYYEKARNLGFLSLELNKAIALNLMAQKQWEKALAELEAIESDSSVERYLYLGECYENLKRPLNAYKAYLKATEIDANSAVAFAKLGDVLFLQRDFPAAKEAYERALALDTTGTHIDRQLVRKRANEAEPDPKK